MHAALNIYSLKCFNHSTKNDILKRTFKISNCQSLTPKRQNVTFQMFRKMFFKKVFFSVVSNNIFVSFSMILRSCLSFITIQKAKILE